jgi:hypothetical protein
MVILLEREKLVELPQVRQGQAHVAYRCRLLPLGQRCRHRRRHAAAYTHQDRLDVKALGDPALFDHALHHRDGMDVEQLQDANILLDAAPRSVLTLQRGPEFGEQRRQMPAVKHPGVIQRRRPALQRFQVMTRIEHLLMPAVTARLRGDHLAAQHHVHALHVELHRDVLERRRTRHAVAIGIHADRLIFIHSGRLQ